MLTFFRAMWRRTGPFMILGTCRAPGSRRLQNGYAFRNGTVRLVPRKTSEISEKPAMSIAILRATVASLGGKGDTVLRLQRLPNEGIIATPESWCPNPREFGLTQFATVFISRCDS